MFLIILLYSTKENLFPNAHEGENSELVKEKGFTVSQATSPLTLLDEQLDRGRVLCVPIFSPAPVPSCVLLSQVAHHHRVSPIFLGAAGYLYSPFVGLVHKAVRIHEQGAGCFLPPAQILLLVVPLGIIVALQGQRASHCAAQKFGSLGKGGGCRLEGMVLVFRAPHPGLQETRVVPQCPVLPVTTCKATARRPSRLLSLPIPHLYSPESSFFKSFIKILNAPELS